MTDREAMLHRLGETLRMQKNGGAVNHELALTLVRTALHEIAPEVDLDAVPLDGELHVDLDLDSLDFLNLVTALHEATGVDIPERDYPLLATIGGLTDYVATRAA